MCGINGFNFNDERLILAMNNSIKHRGPNGQGINLFENLSLGQVRLSILDLSDAGHQPMFYSKKYGASSEKFNSKNIYLSNISIVFNGEIYNYIELKEVLEKLGYVFTTHSDTEVILASYLEWGEECVKRFNGMWAFVIYDEKKKILFCSRDRLGVKPFYYYLKNGKFIFSSELKGILEHKRLNINKKENLNSDAVKFYFSLGFIPSPLSIYKDVFKLEASHNMVFDLNENKIEKIYRYFMPKKYAPVHNKKELILEGRKLLKDAVKLRMRSDVPVGAFLSGGLDSSSVVAEMKQLTDISKLHTFSIGFEGKKYDETPYINIVKNYIGSNHHHYYFKENDFNALTEKYAEIYDEPFGDYSGFPTYKLSEITKKHVTVSLSGDGGDEIFGGYMNHVTGYRMDILRKFPRFLRKIGSKIPARKNLNSFTSFYLLKEAMKVSLEPKEKFYALALASQGIKPQIYKDWTEEKLKICLELGGNKLGEALRLHDLMFNSLQDNFLVKVDRASMANALEVRSPFLDYRFIDFSQKIPTSWKQDSMKTKKLMREIIKDILPKEIVNRGKQGFTPPLKEWLIKSDYTKNLKIAMENLKPIDTEIYDFFNQKALKEDNDLYINYRIRLYLFSLWYQRWVK